MVLRGERIGQESLAAIVFFQRGLGGVLIQHKRQDKLGPLHTAELPRNDRWVAAVRAACRGSRLVTDQLCAAGRAGIAAQPGGLVFAPDGVGRRCLFILCRGFGSGFFFGIERFDLGSIVAAANKLLIAQPSLSNQLKNIEKTYGAKLLLRGNRSLELTDAGRIFYKRAKEICMMEEGLRNELLNQKAGFSELLKISIPAGNSPYFLHKFFDAFIAKHPKVNYDFYEIPSEFVIPNVLNGITEIGLIRSAAPGHGALTLYPYEKEDIVALFPKDHPLAKIKGKLSVPNLANYPLAIPFDCLDIVYASFGHYLLSPNVSMITSPKTTAIEWARSFGSVALVSLTKEDMREIKDMCIKYISDENLYIMSAFIISKDRHLSKIAKEFLQVHGIEVS